MLRCRRSLSASNWPSLSENFLVFANREFDCRIRSAYFVSRKFFSLAAQLIAGFSLKNHLSLFRLPKLFASRTSCSPQTGSFPSRTGEHSSHVRPTEPAGKQQNGLPLAGQSQTLALCSKMIGSSQIPFFNRAQNSFPTIPSRIQPSVNRTGSIER